MFLWFTSILTLAAAAADIIHYRRLRRRGTSARNLRLFVALAAATDALPPVIALTDALSRDNTTGFMLFAMWAFWVWMITVLPRIACYFFRLVGLPRAGIAAGICVAALLIWGSTRGRTQIRVSRTEVCSERIPAGFDGFRIVQFSDVHLGTLVCPEAELSRIADSINSLHPDLVVFCGDLVNIRYTELDSTAMRLLGGIRSRYGTFSITGNHDTGNYVRDTLSLPPATNIAALVERQRAMGWRVLDNETVYLRRGDDSISLSGISYDRSLARQRHDRTLPGYDFGTTYRDVPQELYNITAAHIPQLWEQILDAGYGDLTLSGHVHSMQGKIRLFGRAFSPAQLMYRHWSGPYEKQGRTLYVNDGIGYVGFPMRIGANPEITLFELRR